MNNKLKGLHNTSQQVHFTTSSSGNGDTLDEYWGRIAKLEKVDDICITDNGAVDKNNIIKSSPKIIDLIEVGDYVNGHFVFDIAYTPKKAVYIEDNQNKLAHRPYTNEDIYSIVTKEQFESMEYKVGEQ